MKNLPLWLVGLGAYLAAKDHVRAQLTQWTYVEIGRTVLVAYADWCAAQRMESAKAYQHRKPNKKPRPAA